MTDKDELFQGIEDAANNLFGQYVVKRTNTSESVTSSSSGLELDLNKKPASDSITDQPTPETKASAAAPAAPTAPVAPTAPTAPVAPPSTHPPAAGHGEHLFSELEEALLTIDWEINHESLTKGREALAQLVANQGWPTTSTIGQVTTQMDKILASMLESPEKSPVSAPSQLKNTLQVIREITASGTPLSAEDNKHLEAALVTLKSLLTSKAAEGGDPNQKIKDDLQAATPVVAQEPSFDLGLEMDADQVSAGEIVPGATVSVLKSFVSAIDTLVRLITPMENLFASRPSLAKILTVTQQVKNNLTDQHHLLDENFSSDFSSYTGLGNVHSWLESQLDVLKSCIAKIGKLEKLFSKTAGYEKLFNRSKKIRLTLEKQADAILVAVGGAPTQHQFDLTGEYPAVIQPASHRETDAPAAAVSAVTSPEKMIGRCIDLAKAIEANSGADPRQSALQILETLDKLKVALSGSIVHSPGAMAAANAAVSVAGHRAKCRWDWLLKTTWAGQLVGFAPEQLVFESKSTFNLSSFKDMTYFSLKKLKSMPWSNLQNMFGGEMAEMDNNALGEMEIQIANPPSSFPGSSRKKVYMVILYSGGIGKIYLIDSPTEAISVDEEALWAPGTSSQSDIAGTLTVYGSTMPVISID